MSSNGLRIAVVGAGIAGLTTAAALLRAGLRCQIFEQATRLGEVGAGIQLAPNATRILHRLGLAPALRETGVRAQALETRRWDDGTVLARIPLGVRCEELFGAPYYLLHRADLHRSLLELLPDNVIRLGSSCTGSIQRADHVELRFADGTRATADVVIGADGIHSTVRKALVVDTARFSGHTIYRGLVPVDRVPFFRDEVTLWRGPDRHCVAYPIAARRLISFGATTPAAEWHTESWSARGRVADLRAAYAGWTDEVRRLIAAADTVSRWALHDREALASWHGRRLTVAGDAAHPMLPFLAQGANQAIEDAVVLAACLREATRETIPAALERYAGQRMRRTTQIQEASRTQANVPELERQEWLYGFDAESALSSKET